VVGRNGDVVLTIADWISGVRGQGAGWRKNK